MSENKMNIFSQRVNLKPYEYPELIQFKDAIQHSYWLHKEFNYTQDVQDYHTRVTQSEKNAIKNTMLAISQIEVAVKTFWGRLYDRMPKPEIAMVGYVFAESECYIDGTEVLTPTGWKDIKHINAGDKVYQYNEDKTLSLVNVSHTITKDYQGVMYRFGKSTRNVQQAIVTPNHEMVMYNKNTNTFVKRLAKDVVTSNTNYMWPEAAKLKSDSEARLTADERIRIALQADGTLRYFTDRKGNKKLRGSTLGGNQYEISLSKRRKQERLLTLLNLSTYTYTEFKISRPNCRKFHIQTNEQDNFKEFDWVNLEDKSAAWCEDFIQELAEWDGTRLDKKDCLIKFTTTNKNVADKVQAIAVLAGYRVTYAVREDKRESTYKNVYTLSFVKNRELTTFGPIKKQEIEYAGKVRCITVPSGMLLTRYDNQTFIAGNCRHLETYAHLLEILGLNSEFDKILEVPAIRDRVNYLERYLEGAKSRDDKAYTMSLMLFSIFTENVSLFSQFLIMMAFNKHKNLFKGVSNAVQATSKEECYIDGTEVLTPHGWRMLRDMKVGDDIYQYNADKTITPTKVLHHTAKHYSGDMLKFSKRKHHTLVTPNHDMVFFRPNGTLEKRKAIDFNGDSKKFLPQSGVLLQEGSTTLSAMDKLRIAIQADGTKIDWINAAGDKIGRGTKGGYNYSISLYKQHKIDRLKSILSELPNIEYTERSITNKRVGVEFKLKLDDTFDYKTLDWVDVSDKSVQWCKEFIHELAQWGGYINSNTSIGYSSTNKACIDKAQLVGILAGYETTIQRSNDSKHKDTFNDCYKLSFNIRKHIVPSHSLNKTTESYDGMVYCVTVPSGVIITRHEDETFIAGNCIHGLFGIQLINIIKREHPEWFDSEWEAKIIRACKKAYAAENKVLDWIFEQGELDFLPKSTIQAFIQDRFNRSLQAVGIEPIFEVDNAELEKVAWFEEEVLSSSHVDFFDKRPTTYSKFTQSVTAEDLF